MKTTKLIVALALAVNAAGALAQTGGTSNPFSREAVEKFVQPSEQVKRWEQETEAQKQKLEREGFPQYNY